MVFLGRTPIKWSSTRQGEIESSTYGAEFIAGQAATEELKALRYTLRSFSIHMTKPSYIYGDNLGMLQAFTIPNSTLKKKYCDISYHVCREAVAAGIITPRKVATSINQSDVCTKSLTAGVLYNLLDPMWYRPGRGC